MDMGIILIFLSFDYKTTYLLVIEFTKNLYISEETINRWVSIDFVTIPVLLPNPPIILL